MSTAALPRTGPGVRDRAALRVALPRAAGRFAALLRDLDPAQAATPVPGLEWTVAETAAHVATVVRRCLGDRRRSSDPAGTAALNATCLDEFAERDLGALAAEITAGIATVVGTVMPRLPDDDLPVPFHGGMRLRLLSAYGVVLAELLLHGHDVAGAVGAPWPMRDDDAALAVQALLEAAPGWVDPAVLEAGRRELRVRLPEPFPAYLVTLDAAGLAVQAEEPAPGYADAPATLLAMAHRARSPDPGVRALAAALLPF